MSAASAPLSTLRIVLLVCLPFAGGYYLSYLYRAVNAIIAPNLVQEIGLGATDLGVLTAAYFLAFAAFQVPLGILLDRFGPRRVQACVMLSAALGAVVFGLGETKLTLTTGRALIGVGVAGGLMSSFKAISLWFPQERWPLANGCFLAAGGLGAVSATAPVELLLGVTDWRGIFLALAAINLAVCAAIWFVVPERPNSTATGSVAEAFAGVGKVLRERLFWRIVPIGIFTMGTGIAVQTLWVVPWLKDVAGLDRAGVAAEAFFVACLLIVGFVGTGVVADRLGRRGVSLETMVHWIAVLFILSQVPLAFGWTGLRVFSWIGISILANATVLLYPMLSANFPRELGGRANTTLNTAVFGGCFVLQAAIGWIIDMWPPLAPGSYDPDAYRAAFAILLALEIAAWLWYLVPHRRAASSLSRAPGE